MTELENVDIVDQAFDEAASGADIVTPIDYRPNVVDGMIQFSDLDEYASALRLLAAANHASYSAWAQQNGIRSLYMVIHEAQDKLDAGSSDANAIIKSHPQLRVTTEGLVYAVDFSDAHARMLSVEGFELVGERLEFSNQNTYYGTTLQHRSDLRRVLDGADPTDFPAVEAVLIPNSQLIARENEPLNVPCGANAPREWISDPVRRKEDNDDHFLAGRMQILQKVTRRATTGHRVIVELVLTTGSYRNRVTNKYNTRHLHKLDFQWIRANTIGRSDEQYLAGVVFNEPWGDQVSTVRNLLDQEFSETIDENDAKNVGRMVITNINSNNSVLTHRGMSPNYNWIPTCQ